MEARRNAVFEEMHTAVAAVYCVPSLAHSLKYNGRHLQLDETRNIPSWCHRVDSITSQVLDALAAICVSEPDSAYAVTHEVEGSSLELLVASNLAGGVPDNVVRHLEHVWSHMRLLAATTGHPHSKRAEFVVELYSFAWPALRHRLASKAPVITQALDSMAEQQNIYNGNGSRAVLSEDVTATFRSIRALVETLHASVLNNHNDEVPSIEVHDTSVALRKLLAGKDVLSALESFCEFAPGAPNIAAEIFSIVWLSSAADFLFAFGSSAQFASMASLDFRVAPIASCSRPTLVNADIPQLRKEAAVSYVDSMMSNPEPNFDADFTSVVLQPLRRCLEFDADFTSGVLQPLRRCLEPVNAREVAAHAESALLAHIELRGSDSNYKRGPPYCQYIGTSEPSCLPCFRLFEALNSALSQTRWMFVRGTTSRAPLLWVPPDFSSDLFIMRATKSLWWDFQNALSIVRKERTRARQEEREARGQVPLTKDEEEYSVRSRGLNALCSSGR